MEKIIQRAAITDSLFKEMLKTERHHKHPIIKHPDGGLSWKVYPDVRKKVDEIGLNEIWKLFDTLCFDRNSEVLRDMYRKMGYSLFGYWEIFYWEGNNEIAHLYKPPVQK